jgi:hypothetical protein
VLLTVSPVAQVPAVPSLWSIAIFGLLKRF